MRGLRTAVLAAILGVILGVSCGSGPRGAQGNSPEVVSPAASQESATYQILDHKMKFRGEEPPDWVDRYIDEGIRGVEMLPRFQDVYVFVDDFSGTNMEALNQWFEGYLVNQDVRQLIAARVQERLIDGARGDPDVVYGRFFESLIRAVSDASYPEAQRAGDYWILKRFFIQEEGAPIPSEYQFLILLTIDRRVLERHIISLLNQNRTVGRPTRNQTAAIDRLAGTFFVNF